jgi:hypothetical protein
VVNVVEVDKVCVEEELELVNVVVIWAAVVDARELVGFAIEVVEVLVGRAVVEEVVKEVVIVLVPTVVVELKVEVELVVNVEGAVLVIVPAVVVGRGVVVTTNVVVKA